MSNETIRTSAACGIVNSVHKRHHGYELHPNEQKTHHQHNARVLVARLLVNEVEETRGLMQIARGGGLLCYLLPSNVTHEIDRGVVMGLFGFNGRIALLNLQNQAKYV